MFQESGAVSGVYPSKVNRVSSQSLSFFPASTFTGMDNHYTSRSMPPPPPLPPASAQHDQDPVYDRYKRLKRLYIEMEQKFNAMYVDLQRAGEQNRRLVRERDMLLDRIHDMNVSQSSPSSTPVASTSLAASSRGVPDVYSSRNAPPPIRGSREAALQRFLDEDSDEDIPPPHRPSVNYDRRDFTASTINGVENGSRPYAVPDRDRYSHPPPPAGPVNSTPSHPVYSPESTPTPYHRHQSSASATSISQFQAHSNSNDVGNNNATSSQPSRHHPHHPQASSQPHIIHEPYHPPYAHSGHRSRTPPSTSPLSEYSSHKRALDMDAEEAASKRVRLGQYHQHQLQQSSGSLSKPVSSTSSQSAAFANGSPSPPVQEQAPRGGGARGGRSRRGRAGSVSAANAADAPVKKRRSRQSKSARDSEKVISDEEVGHSMDRRSHHDSLEPPIPASSRRQGPVKERSASPPVPPPSMPMNIIRGGSSPSRSYSPAPPALPPTGPPPRNRLSSVADARNSSRSNAHAPPPPLALPRPRSTKPKRLKAHTVQSKSYSIPTVPRIPDGRPQLPLNVGIMTVRNLGKVCLEKHFHTERYIFPVGYEVTRRYFSMHNPETEAQYTCTILHGSDIDGGSGPRFKIVASDDVDHPIIAGTATGAWSVIVKAANKIRNRQHSNSVSGPDYFGLGQNTIKHLLQELDNATLLQDYVRQTFIEGGPLGGRHAAVTAAINLDDKPPQPTASTSHVRPHAHTSKSSSPMDQPPDDQEPDGSSVMGADLERELEGNEVNDSISHGNVSPPPVRSPRGPRGSVHDEEGGYPHSSSSSKVPSIQTFNQQQPPPISQQRGSPTGPVHSHSHSRSSFDSRSPSEKDRGEKERDRERYGPDSPNMPSGMRGLMNPYNNSPDGSRSEYSPNSRQGKAPLSPREDYHDRDREREDYRSRMPPSPQ